MTRRTRPSEMLRTSAPPALLFLNNYPGGGIGDFGSRLARHLREESGEVILETTDPEGRGEFAQLKRVRRHPGGVLVNLGLTAWGRSGARNYLGYSSLGRRHAGLPTVVIIHHLIEAIEPGDSGYSISRLTRWGGHRAASRLTDYGLATFSPKLAELLHRSYDAQRVWTTPLPMDVPVRPPDAAGASPRVVSAGYLAPYKGVDRFLAAGEALRGSGEFWLVGRPHPLLASDPNFVRQLNRWSRAAAAANVQMPGFLDDRHLDDLLTSGAVGVLPYSSTSGASASFGLFASRSIPVVASDLPEFRYLRELGAGIELVGPGPGELEDAVGGLLESNTRWSQLSDRQYEFARLHDWHSFIGGLRKNYPEIVPGHPGSAGISAPQG